jgi:predicted nuclease of restriction endonuclease-like (RecB) superfamily
MCRLERWSVRTLQKKIDGMLFERTALSKRPEKLVEQEIAALRNADQRHRSRCFIYDYAG